MTHTKAMIVEFISSMENAGRINISEIP